MTNAKTLKRLFWSAGRGQVSPIIAPASRLGAQGAVVLGIEVKGFVSLEAERGLREMLWPAMQLDRLFAKITEAGG